MRTSWTNELVESELRQIINGSGIMPSNSELQKMGRTDLSVQISRRGGFMEWASKVGASRTHSDSDTGWRGEQEVAKWLSILGLVVEMRDGIKCPYDLLIEGVVRVDVKTAAFANYGVCSGWFYRIGKHMQADVAILWRSDRQDGFIIPWKFCPTTNITISPKMTKYDRFHNAIKTLQDMVNMRKIENIAQQSNP